MTWAAIEWARKVRTGSGTAKAVLAYLAERSNNDWQCYPSLSRIAQDMEFDPSTVGRALLALESAGWVTRTARGRDGGGRTSNLYQLNEKPVKKPDGKLGAAPKLGGGQQSPWWTVGAT